MIAIKDILVYILSKYPNVNELSMPRLVKIMYLADWKNTIETGEQISNIKWFFNHYGPFVDEVMLEAKANEDIFSVESRPNQYGGLSERIKLKYDKNADLMESYKKSLDFIINNTVDMNWSEFISLVYSTYPVASSPKFSTLDLKEKAKEFKAL